MNPSEWKFRARLFVERYWQPTSACLSCMPGSLGNIGSFAHWTLALQTGLATGVLAVLLSFTPVGRLYRNRWGNALVVGCLTALGDAWSHPNHYPLAFAEPLVTGLTSGLLALVGTYLLEDHARRLRALWARLTGRSQSNR